MISAVITLKVGISRYALCLAILITMLGGIALAQSATRPCEMSRDVRLALDALDDDDASGTFTARHETLLAGLRRLLQRYPDDLFVHRRYQDVAREGQGDDLMGLTEQYRRSLSQHPSDPLYHYLYGRLLIGRKTPEALTQMQTALQHDPKFAWPHLSLANIYSVPRFKDKVKGREAIAAFMALCPTTLNADAYRYVMDADAPALLAESIRKLRERLDNSSETHELAAYETLWRAEFRARPVPEHPQVRQQMQKDLARMRQMQLMKDRRWLTMLRTGYQLTSDQDGLHWVEDQIINQLPNSELAMRVMQARWKKENPYPDKTAGPEKLREYNGRRMQATQEWIRRWPNDPAIRLTRLEAVAAGKETPAPEVEAAADALMLAIEKDPQRGRDYPPTAYS